MDIKHKDDMKIALSPDGNQAAFWSDSVITICNIIKKDCFLFRPWPRGRHCFIGKIAFQTCNDLVICTKCYAPSVITLSFELSKRHTLILNNTRELDRIPKYKLSTLYMNYCWSALHFFSPILITMCFP